MIKRFLTACTALLFFAFFGCTQPLTAARPDLPAPNDADSAAQATQDSANHSRRPSGSTPSAATSTRPKSGEPASTSEPESRPSAQRKAEEAAMDEALELCHASQEYWQKGELENALEALDQAYTLILSVDGEDDLESIQQKDDLRFMISKRILEIYASRNIVVNGHHEAIPMTINSHVQSEIDNFTKGHEKEFFKASYQRSGRYRAYIATKLIEAGLPEELSWLPLIESGFKPTALSSARALGLWQFIPSTGYKFGLKRDKYIDERLDPIKSTGAAIDYLKELHQIFGDWTTVLAGYNCGEGRVLRVIRSQNVNYLDNFWDLYQRLPRETARYVPRFLATLHIVKNLEKYGLQDAPLDPALEYEIYWVNKQVRLRDVSEAIGVPVGTLRTLNPELRHRILPSEDYPLKVPPGKCDLLAVTLDAIPVCTPPRQTSSASRQTSSASQSTYTYHKIRKGETLSTIARRYGTSVGKIVSANNMGRKRTIVTGKRLKIPLKGGHSKQPAPPPKTYAAKSTTHVVSKGDSLWILANRYGTTTREIQEANRMRGTRLHIGQALKIPGESQAKKSRTEFKTYQVKSKDSPYRIARVHNMDLERFLRINKLTPRSKIYPGQSLNVE